MFHFNRHKFTTPKTSETAIILRESDTIMVSLSDTTRETFAQPPLTGKVLKDVFRARGLFALSREKFLKASSPPSRRFLMNFNVSLYHLKRVS